MYQMRMETIDWCQIDTVLLDMDGTLLDLHFDNQFWQTLLPARYAEHHGMALEQARAHLFQRFSATEGTLQWYCLDYWREELGLNVVQLKKELVHLIAILPHAVTFLKAIRDAGKRVVLVTNAHRDSLTLKMESTRLEPYFDTIVSSHDYGAPKEEQAFWQQLSGQLQLEKGRALLIDDSLSVLRSAQRFGIGQLRAVRKPDSQLPARLIEEFHAIDSLLDIMP